MGATAVNYTNHNGKCCKIIEIWSLEEIANPITKENAAPPAFIKKRLSAIAVTCVSRQAASSNLPRLESPSVSETIRPEGNMFMNPLARLFPGPCHVPELATVKPR